MSNPKEWTEADLVSLVKESATENTELEFKRCAAVTKNPEGKAEISRDVSAMANAAGGTIIYGIVEKDHVATAVEGFDESLVSKEFLDQVISSNIQPHIEGLRIHRVPLKSSGVSAPPVPGLGR